MKTKTKKMLLVLPALFLIIGIIVFAGFSINSGGFASGAQARNDSIAANSNRNCDYDMEYCPMAQGENCRRHDGGCQRGDMDAGRCDRTNGRREASKNAGRCC
ncbi:MAG: hypothetical protein FWE03_06600 [Firmicutes bacterium]|nr:hypothetical protein [Bacillota bacterium]